MIIFYSVTTFILWQARKEKAVVEALDATESLSNYPTKQEATPVNTSMSTLHQIPTPQRVNRRRYAGKHSAEWHQSWLLARPFREFGLAAHDP